MVRFAQHLLDRGVVQFRAGAFSLPADLDSADLPSSLAATLQSRVLGLSDDARELAYALCLCPDHRFAFAECARLIVEGAAPGRHQVWQALACCHVQVLHGLGRQEQALERADTCAGVAKEVLGRPSARLSLVRAQVHGSARHGEAADMAEHVLAQHAADGVTGIQLGLAHEVRARIAVYLGDGAAYEQHLAACARIYGAHAHPALAAKVERLRQLMAPARAEGQQLVAAQHAEFSALLVRCSSREERAAALLRALSLECRASAGVLFGIQAGAPVLVATQGAMELTPELLERVTGAWAASRAAADTTQTHSGSDSGDASGELRTDCELWLLSHQEDRGLTISGLVVLAGLDATLRVPARLLSELSRAWTAYPDSEPLHVEA